MLQMQDISSHDYQRFKTFLEQACGIILGEGKQYLIASRLTRLLRDENIANLSDLMISIERGHPRHLRDAVVDAMTTNETSWFRDGVPFETLAQHVFPEFDKKRTGPIRIWSSACSSGQEPYTISMIISEYCRKQLSSQLAQSQIMATDISGSILAEAKRAEYEDVALGRGLSSNRRQQFFTKQDTRWRVSDDIRRRVSFREQNLLQGFAALGRFDIIFCRNVLIYFSAERKKDILKRMAQSLNRGGYLFLGASETISGYSDAFESVRTPFSTIYRRKD
ncbi:CheR family methyltransferase [Methylophaga thiooxydans]|uniref:Chemotaxis protein methyltransferase n=1 Tax=Methylophaga thiooxydans DMS010 TaxID=637616 RepID=C0N8Q3_9GAMM|nr:protein-glutamate O-methyltransferase CheR [Methylophaga thiooxydans]EEF78869.1 CheR methyltransferase, SAM binding domain [Methylophaga thiooxydans DMS010]